MTKHILQWLFNDTSLYAELEQAELDKLDPLRVSMFVLLHLGCLLVFITGVSTVAVVLMLSLYLIRMFFITAFYHRYFSHKTYKTSRAVQFLMAVLGCTSGQRGPLWWAAHHRVHHLSSDTGSDPHSPAHGFLNSHLLWFLRKRNFITPVQRIPDWLRFPELVALEKIDWLPFLLLAIGCYALGDYLQVHYPALQTDGLQLLVWGFIISTVLLYHGTYTINSLAHRFGSRRFATNDESRNNALLALITLGEGWHNNHHRFPTSARQGFYNGEVDISYLGLKFLAFIGLAHDLRSVPLSVLEEGRRGAVR